MKSLFLALGVVALLGAGCSGAATNDEVQATKDEGNVREKSALIVVQEPYANAVVASPLTITGEARGTWFFEASFPVELQDTDGNVIAQGHAEAQGDWMTEDFVPYIATLAFVVPTGVTDGVLYLRKDSPSGLPANEDALYIPVQF